MASREQLASLKRMLNRDKRMLRLKDSFDTLPEYRMDFRDLHEELDTMMSTRPIRSLNTKGNFIDNITEAMLTDQQYRSRVTEIMMACVKTEKKLGRSIDQIGDYLRTEYHSQIMAVFRTKADRVTFTDHILRKYINYLDKVDELKQRCMLLTTDIDKAGYAFKGMLEAVQIGARKVSEY